MKTLIPWLCAILAVGGAAYLYSASSKKDAEMATLRAASQETETLRAENAELKKAQVPTEEITRLRKESEDVLRLRNEVRQLRDEKKQLTQQAQTAQADIQRAQAQTQAARAQAQALSTNTARALTPEQQATVARFAKMQETQQLNACINNLRQIDAAKQQWALEHTKLPTSVPTDQEIAAYIPGNVLPPCPAGGKYTLNAVDHYPTCSIPGHALAQ